MNDVIHIIGTSPGKLLYATPETIEVKHASSVFTAAVVVRMTRLKPAILYPPPPALQQITLLGGYFISQGESTKENYKESKV